MTAPRVALLTISDRPDLLKGTLTSLAQATGGELGDPGGSPFVEHVHVDDRQHTFGFAGAIRQGWLRLRASSVAFDYVLHVEDDWRFDAPVDLARMAEVLRRRPELAQIALRRNAVAPVEHAAGGVIELWPELYHEALIVADDCPRLDWLEHELYFTTNPSLYRRGLLELGWPDGPASEQEFTAKCLRAGLRFALYGARADAPRVTHLGTDRREGRGY